MITTKTLFYIIIIIVILIVSSVNLHKIKFVVIVDSNNDLKTQSTLTGLRNSNSSNEIVVEIYQLFNDTTEDRICHQIFNSTPAIPVFMIDISVSNTFGKILARKMGIPSLRSSTLINSQKENIGWKNLNQIENNILVSIIRPETTILHMIKDITNQYHYKAIVVIYDDTFEMAYSDHIIKNVKITAINWSELNINTIETNFNQLKQSDISQTFFVFGTISTLNQVLLNANKHNMFGTFKAWYFVSKEKGRVKCETCDNVEIMVSQPLKSRLHYYEDKPSMELSNDTINIVDIYFYYDQARFYAQTVDEMIEADITILNQTYPSCGKYLTDIQMGQRENIPLYQSLSKKFLYGLFGQFRFNYNSDLNYQELTMRINKVSFKNGTTKHIAKLAEWEFEGQLGRLYFTLAQEQNQKPGIPHYNIVTIIEAPFIMEVNDNTTKGNDRFYGYCIDLLKEIVNQSELKFEYTIRLVNDNQYGHKDDNNEWGGVIGELVRKKADIALGPISVMAEREIVVDFTVPYYDLVGITILIKKPTVPSHLFKFLTVLETNVWLCILAAYFFTSFLMYLFDRLSPYSYHNNQEKYKDDEEKREFTLKECLWFCMTSLTPQGGGEAPRNLSGRLVAATWWLFGFIIIASYTANLAAFLTVSRLDSPIESLDDLSKQYKIKYAPQAGTATSTYFERMAGIEEKFYEIWKDMSLNDSLSDEERAKLAVWDYPVSDKYTKIWSEIMEAKMPQSWAEGLRRVKNEDKTNEQFAFISESTLAKYAVMTNCDLQNIGNEFSRKPLALAVQQNSDLKDRLSSAILKLLNQRKLETLKERWWNRNPEKKDCQDSKKQSDGISIHNIGGVFIVIFIGVVLACITLVIEYWYFKGKESKVISINRQKHDQFNYNSKKNETNLNYHLNDQKLMLRFQSKNAYN